MPNINNINTPINIRIKKDPRNRLNSERKHENEKFLSTLIEIISYMKMMSKEQRKEIVEQNADILNKIVNFISSEQSRTRS